MMDNILTLININAGIEKWQERGWPNDFHNSLYDNLRKDLHDSDLNEEWWCLVVDKLAQWNATRPLSRDRVRENGICLLERINAEYDYIVKTSEREISLATASWTTLSRLFTVASKIKQLKHPSPVFPSKLCHFIFPDAFPVMDRLAVGIGTRYEEYWLDCSRQWKTCPTKAELIHTLRDIIEHDSPGRLVNHFPWSTKITELCVIGAKASRSVRRPDKSTL
jgi:hypothetical protein